MPAQAEPPVILDRLVATVDARAIFRSDLTGRAGPYIATLPAAEQSDPKRINQLLHELLEQMIDEHLVAQDCLRAQISVEPHEVDRAIDEVAKANKMSVKELLTAAKQQGLTEDGYKAEVRRQILDMKWSTLLLRPRVNAPIVGTDAEKAEATAKLVEAERKKTLALLRADAFVEVKW